MPGRSLGSRSARGERDMLLRDTACMEWKFPNRARREAIQAAITLSDNDMIGSGASKVKTSEDTSSHQGPGIKEGGGRREAAGGRRRWRRKQGVLVDRTATTLLHSFPPGFASRLPPPASPPRFLVPTSPHESSNRGLTYRQVMKATIPVSSRDKPHEGMETDQLMIRRAITGDERALRHLWTQHAPHIDAVVRRLVGDSDLAADIAQDVWMQIFRALPGFRGEAQFGTWAHRIAVNRTLNALRKSRRLEKIETEMEEDTAMVEMDDEAAFVAESIDQAAACLPPGARTVFFLHDVEGYTHEDIATELGITAGASKSQLFKARAKLRRLLAHLVDGPQPARNRSHVAS